MPHTPHTAIIGYGHVGHAVHTIFPDAKIYDPQLSAYQHTKTTVQHSQLAFICVPTPPQADGQADLSHIHDVLSWLQAEIIVIKSTVPPGSTAYLSQHYNKRIVFYPEFTGESSYELPSGFSSLAWPLVLVGGQAEDTRVLVRHLASRLGPDKTYRQCSSTQAELAKYMINSWLATQVIFANTFHDLSEALGEDYFELRELFASDPRTSKWHTLVMAEPGFGGKCLPKDLSAIIALATRLEVDIALLNSVQEINQKLRH